MAVVHVTHHGAMARAPTTAKADLRVVMADVKVAVADAVDVADAVVALTEVHANAWTWTANPWPRVKAWPCKALLPNHKPRKTQADLTVAPMAALKDVAKVVASARTETPSETPNGVASGLNAARIAALSAVPNAATDPAGAGVASGVKPAMTHRWMVAKQARRTQRATQRKCANLANPENRVNPAKAVSPASPAKADAAKTGVKAVQSARLAPLRAKRALQRLRRTTCKHRATAEPMRKATTVKAARSAHGIVMVATVARVVSAVNAMTVVTAPTLRHPNRARKRSSHWKALATQFRKKKARLPPPLLTL
jgi:hypothetical protein